MEKALPNVSHLSLARHISSLCENRQRTFAACHVTQTLDYGLEMLKVLLVMLFTNHSITNFVDVNQMLHPVKNNILLNSNSYNVITQRGCPT